MNIIEVIKNELSSEVLGKLSSLIGESEDKTKFALGAAVPGLLSLLSSLVSTGSGSDKLINALKQVDPGTQGGFGDILAAPPAAAQEKGTSLINILLGSGALPAIISILGKFAGIDAAKVKSLLGYLAPMILSMIAKQLAGKTLSPQVVSSFFADQKSNISSALPAGFSLADIPGLSAVSSTSKAVSSAVREESSGLPAWLLPLVGLGLLGLLAWYFLGAPPAEEPAPTPAGGGPLRPRSQGRYAPQGR